MAECIENTCNIMEKEGYVLVGSPTPVIKGVGVNRHAVLINKKEYGGGWGYGYGFSFTSGVTLLFHK